VRGLLERAEHVVPGHGPTMDGEGALSVLEEDLAYLQGLCERGADAPLPDGRRGPGQRELHAHNAASLAKN
jgi:hypothetical protein